MTAAFERVGPTTVFRVSGDLDFGSVPTIRADGEGALTVDVREFVVDMREVSFVDSSGIGFLLDLRHAADQVGATMRLTDVPPRVMKLLELMALTDFLGAPR